MAGIATLTVNPALDLWTRVDRLVPGHKLRCDTPRVQPGGGGINVARVLCRLGHGVLACHTQGGSTGTRLGRLLDGEGIPHLAIPIAADTRENLAVHEAASGQEYRFVLPGPSVQEPEWQACIDAVTGAGCAAWLVASGSLAPDMPDDFYARLARAAAQRGVLLALDTSGPPLAAALRAGVHLIKPSLRELRELAGDPLPTTAAQLAAAAAIVRSGAARLVAVSLGADGALLAAPGIALQARAPAVPVASTVGAGDSFLAGLVASLAREEPLQAALVAAVAAGTASVQAEATTAPAPGEIERLRPQVQVTQLA